jgi:hypothetical protein
MFDSDRRTPNGWAESPGRKVMATFLFLYSGGGMPEGEAETKKVMDAWAAWMAKYQGAIADPGNPFTPVAKTVAQGGAVSDGPVGTPASGYTVVKADSLDAALGMAKDCPVLMGGAKISVYEAFDVTAMAGAGAQAQGHEH